MYKFLPVCMYVHGEHVLHPRKPEEGAGFSREN